MEASSQQSVSKWSIWAALISVYIVWGSTYLAIRFAVETIPPFLMAGVRHLSAGLIVYLWRRLAGDPRPTLIHWRSAAIVGILMLTGANGLVSWAEQFVPSSVTAILVGSVPLWIMLMSLVQSLFGKKETKPSWIAIVGILIGFGGIVLLVSPWQTGGIGNVNLLGAGALLIGSILWAGGSLYSRSAQLPKSPLMGTALEMISGGMVLLVISGLFGEWGQVNLAAVTTKSVLGLLYLIVFGSLIGFASYTWLLRSAPVSLASTYAYVNPVVAIFMGAMLAGESVNARVIVAALIILGSVALTTRAPSVRSKINRSSVAAAAPAEIRDK